MLIRLVVTALVALVLLAAFGGQPASAHRGTYRVAAGSLGLNIRTGPGGNFKRLYTMPNGRLVKARGHRGSWLYGTDLTTGVTGWMWLAYMELVSGQSSGGTGGGSGAICLTNYWSEYVCSSANVGNAIRYWAGQYGIGWYWLAATAACESNFLDVVNSSSGVTGWFQFQPSTFYWQGGVDIHDPWDQSRIAAKMFANGLAYHFHCAQLIGYA